MVMAETLQATLPWMGLQAEDRRFWRILLQVLVICFVIGGIIPYIQAPLLEPEAAVDLPPRLVRIIEDRMVPAAPPPAASDPAARTPAAPPRPEPREIPDSRPPPVKPDPLVTARQKAAQAGVLAMSKALGELRAVAPKTTTAASGSAASGSDLPKKRQKPSVLAADVAQGSGGIGAGVADRSVLGASGLPGKGGSGQGLSSGQGTIRGTGAPQAGGGAAAHQPGMVRSEEEIQEILDRNKSAMYSIYNRALRQDATLQGKLVLKLTIAPSGRVTRCSIIDSELKAASLEEPLIRLIKGIDFGHKPGVPVVTTKVPIEFFPR